MHGENTISTFAVILGACWEQNGQSFSQDSVPEKWGGFVLFSRSVHHHPLSA